MWCEGWGVEGANEVNIINHASDCWWEECCWKAPRGCVLTKESWERVHTALLLPHISASKCLNLPNAPHSGEMTGVLACYARPASRVWWLFISLEITPMVYTVFKRAMSISLTQTSTRPREYVVYTLDKWKNTNKYSLSKNHILHL